MGIAFITLSMVVYTVHVTCQDIDGGATEADAGASAPVGPSVATPLAAQEAIWLNQLTKNLRNDTTTKEPIVIFEDNQSAICMAKNPQFHGRTKHIEIKYHFIRDQVKKGTVELKYCQTEDMIADIFTKGLQRDKFAKLRQMAGVMLMDKSANK